MRVNLLQTHQVIINRAFYWRGQALADIDADHAIKTRRLHPLNQMINAGVVAAHALADRASLRQTERPWPGVTLLGLGCHGAYLNKTETQRAQRIEMLCILVQTRRQPHPVGKTRSHQFYRISDSLAPQPPGQLQAMSQIQSRERMTMGGFGIEAKQDRTGKRVHGISWRDE